MVPVMGTGLTWHCWLGKEGSVPWAPGSPNLSHPSPGVKQRAGAAWEMGVTQARQSDTAPRECPWEEEAPLAGNEACL